MSLFIEVTAEAAKTTAIHLWHQTAKTIVERTVERFSIPYATQASTGF